MRCWLTRLAATVRRIIGAPDYATYLDHHHACHPGLAPMDEATFVAEQLSARYERPGSRCC